MKREGGNLVSRVYLVSMIKVGVEVWYQGGSVRYQGNLKGL